MTLTQQQLNFWQDNGYLLLANFYSNENIDKFNKIIDDLRKKRNKLAPILSELLGGDLPMICNSLNFEFGSQ